MSAFRSLLGVATLALCALASAGRAEETLSYDQLIHRLTDLSRLAVLPQAGEQGAQWSSYDRASKYDEKTGKYIAWDANGDGQGIIHKEGEQSVMAEMKGPGCIWRIWSAAPDKGHVKIYLDDQEKPVVDLPFAQYFDGKHAPFNFPVLSYNLGEVHSSGQNLYLPIPYQKSCKIVADKDWGNYFHFGYKTYPAGTVLPTFSAELVAEHADQLKAVNCFLAKKLGSDPAGKRAGQKTLTKCVEVAAGETACVARLDGPRAITALLAKIKFANREDEMAGLRKLALRITWDGSTARRSRPIEAGRLVPAGRFLRHGPRRQPLQNAADRHDQAGLLFLLVHAFWQKRRRGTRERGQAAAEDRVRDHPRAAGPAVRRLGAFPLQVASRHDRIAQGPLAGLDHGPRPRVAAASAA